MACSTCSHRVRPEHDLLQSLQCQTLRTTTQTTRLQVPLRRTVRSANGRIGHSLGLLSMWIHSDHARWSRNERLLSALHADPQLLVLETLSHDEQDELLHQGRRQESDIGREHRQATRRCVSICDVFQRMMSVLLTGVLGLCAIVLSSPYEIPIFVPEALMLLCEHSHDPDLIQVGPSREWGCELICCFCRNRSRNRCRSSVALIMIRGMSTVRSSLKINWWCSPMSSFHPAIMHRIPLGAYEPICDRIDHFLRHSRCSWCKHTYLFVRDKIHSIIPFRDVQWCCRLCSLFKNCFLLIVCCCSLKKKKIVLRVTLFVMYRDFREIHAHASKTSTCLWWMDCSEHADSWISTVGKAWCFT